MVCWGRALTPLEWSAPVEAPAWRVIAVAVRVSVHSAGRFTVTLDPYVDVGNEKAARAGDRRLSLMTRGHPDERSLWPDGRGLRHRRPRLRFGEPRPQRLRPLKRDRLQDLRHHCARPRAGDGLLTIPSSPYRGRTPIVCSTRSRRRDRTRPESGSGRFGGILRGRRPANRASLSKDERRFTGERDGRLQLPSDGSPSLTSITGSVPTRSRLWHCDHCCSMLNNSGGSRSRIDSQQRRRRPSDLVDSG